MNMAQMVGSVSQFACASAPEEIDASRPPLTDKGA